VNINGLKDFFENNKIILLCTVLVAVTMFVLSVVIAKGNSGNFFKSIELKSFDLRQSIIADKKKVSEDVVILTVDDESYEYLINKYGEWPIPRAVYADILDYVESQSPAVVGFDLLFVHSLRNNPNSDAKLAMTMAKYDNAYTAINFDDRDFTVRKPVVLADGLASTLKINDKKFVPQLMTNCRAIFPQLMASTDNIGHINTAKDNDGITRSVPLFVAYPTYSQDENGKFVYENKDIKNYPYMTYKMAVKYLADKAGISVEEFLNNSKIENGKLTLNGKNKIDISNDAKVVLNWYGDTGLVDNKNFKYVPMWKVVDAMTGGEKLAADTFKDKAVFVGTSVFALSDIKSVPTAKYMPGVEIHATLFNNFLDNSFIKPVSTLGNIIISVVVAALIAFVAFFTVRVILLLRFNAGSVKFTKR